MDKRKLAQAAMAAAVSVGVAISPLVAKAGSHDKGKEKCYGIAKKGKNDCAGKGHSCQGHSKKDGDPSTWIFVLKGNCDRIVGGKTKAS